jgi:pimeloyl-ACP methyl ester carboxylesterase
MSLDALLAACPLRHCETALGRIAYREAGAGPALALLHGIGSASDSWVRQLAALPDRFRVLAWNAPGYRDSHLLPMPSPTARDYGERVWAWLDALGVREAVLAGQSLGALMASAATLIAPERVERLVLLAPAAGYGDAPAAVRDARLTERLDNLKALGPQGLADRRGAAMVSAGASEEERAFARAAMAQIVPEGYAQAARMLSTGTLVADLGRVARPVRVASGSEDAITPPASCRSVAEAARTPWIDLGAVGHACQLQAADQVNRLLAGDA